MVFVSLPSSRGALLNESRSTEILWGRSGEREVLRGLGMPRYTKCTPKVNLSALH